jgi:hypothetical protein
MLLVLAKKVRECLDLSGTSREMASDIRLNLPRSEVLKPLKCILYTVLSELKGSLLNDRDVINCSMQPLGSVRFILSSLEDFIMEDGLKWRVRHMTKLLLNELMNSATNYKVPCGCRPSPLEAAQIEGTRT